MEINPTGLMTLYCNLECVVLVEVCGYIFVSGQMNLLHLCGCPSVFILHVLWLYDVHKASIKLVP